MSDDDTLVVPIFTNPHDPHRFERVLFAALCVAYFIAGGVLSFACFELAAVADQLNAAPFCRRI